MGSYREPGLHILGPEWLEIAEHATFSFGKGTPEELRNQVKLPFELPPPSGLTITDKPVPGYDGGTNQVRIYKPEGPSTNGAVLIYVHGGGWTVGTLDTEDAFCRTVCTGNQIVVVSIDYRKAPEHPFPIGIEDVWAGVLWVGNIHPVCQPGHN